MILGDWATNLVWPKFFVRFHCIALLIGYKFYLYGFPRYAFLSYTRQVFDKQQTNFVASITCFHGLHCAVDGFVFDNAIFLSSSGGLRLLDSAINICELWYPERV